VPFISLVRDRYVILLARRISLVRPRVERNRNVNPVDWPVHRARRLASPYQGRHSIGSAAFSLPWGPVRLLSLVWWMIGGKAKTHIPLQGLFRRLDYCPALVLRCIMGNLSFGHRLCIRSGNLIAARSVSWLSLRLAHVCTGGKRPHFRNKTRIYTTVSFPLDSSSFDIPIPRSSQFLLRPLNLTSTSHHFTTASQKGRPIIDVSPSYSHPHQHTVMMPVSSYPPCPGPPPSRPLPPIPGK